MSGNPPQTERLFISREVMSDTVDASLAMKTARTIDLMQRLLDLADDGDLATRRND